ncbi:ion channel [Wenzhouxiangella sp. EGI_FJ10305]|uniref:ion channel n=1 Tax=Wenzhouxiangella sp. EGI_FJ10305 TaxID=3243768 RepID=UPI0035E14A70
MSEIGSAEWTVVLTTALAVMLAITLHFEVIAALNRWGAGKRLSSRGGRHHHHRPTLLLVMFALLLAHIAEIWLFGLAYWGLLSFSELGAIEGYASLNFLDCVYFSATTYTTVGWGDLFATGPVRFLAGTEALVGFMLITWSASFVYLIMARTWGEDDSGL